MCLYDIPGKFIRAKTSLRDARSTVGFTIRFYDIPWMFQLKGNSEDPREYEK
jgi:hypothetical protein